MFSIPDADPVAQPSSLAVPEKTSPGGMLIHCGFDIAFDCTAPTPAMLMLRVHPERQGDIIGSDTVRTDRQLTITEYADSFGNRCERTVLPVGRTHLTTDFVIRDSGIRDPIAMDAVQHPVEALPDEVLVYLLGSRYCETDRLATWAWAQFGHTPLGWQRVQAVVDFVHSHIVFGYAHARPTKTAEDAFTERLGVCRDYAHLAITLCRALNIPARYCTGYLGDIGVPFDPAPMDFSAWFDVYLGNAWHTFDARHNTPRIGRILMARGRDAADVALTNCFGMPTLTNFKVWTEEVAEAPPPVA